MSNTCYIAMPQAWTDAGGTAAEWVSTNGSYTRGGVSNPKLFNASATGTSVNPFYFNADAYGIVCVSFPAAGDTTSLFGVNQTILAHTTAIANLQTQVTALSAGSLTQAPNPQIIEASGFMFAALLGAMAIAYGLKTVYRLFITHGSD